MQLVSACQAILQQLSQTLQQLSQDDFTRPSSALSGSTIGQHLRHTLEFFICLQEGFKKGVVNYDHRSHDKLIETDKFIALSVINRIQEFVQHQQQDKPLQLEVGYHSKSDDVEVINTNYFRELTYNIEHTVHHMAIMKIGFREVAPHVTLPPDFGVAVSTIRHQNTTMASAS